MDNNGTWNISNSTTDAKESTFIVGILLLAYSIPIAVLNTLCIVGIMMNKSIRVTPYKLLIFHIAVVQIQQLVTFSMLGGIFRILRLQVGAKIYLMFFWFMKEWSVWGGNQQI